MEGGVNIWHEGGSGLAVSANNSESGDQVGLLHWERRIEVFNCVEVALSEFPLARDISSLAAVFVLKLHRFIKYGPRTCYRFSAPSGHTKWPPNDHLEFPLARDI